SRSSEGGGTASALWARGSLRRALQGSSTGPMGEGPAAAGPSPPAARLGGTGDGPPLDGASRVHLLPVARAGALRRLHGLPAGLIPGLQPLPLGWAHPGPLRRPGELQDRPHPIALPGPLLGGAEPQRPLLRYHLRHPDHLGAGLGRPLPEEVAGVRLLPDGLL